MAVKRKALSKQVIIFDVRSFIFPAIAGKG